jgi:hypothetical protein
MIRALLTSHLLFTILSSLLFVCGLIAIGNLIAPDFVQQALPHWQARFGSIIAIGVVLGFIRSAWRLVVPIFALIFWIVALGAVFGGPLASQIPSAATIQQRTQAELSRVDDFLKRLPIPERLLHLFR